MTPTDDDQGTTPAASARQRLADRITVISTVLFVALRLPAVAVADVPAINPDEYGSWAIARWLAGSESTLSMGDMARYPVVGGAVLAPVEALGLGPTASYRAGLVVMAALVLASALLLRRAVRVWLPAAAVPAAAAYGLTLLLPATVLSTSFTWAEPTVLCCLAVLVWASVVAWRRPADAAVALCVGGVAAGVAPFTHGRMLFVPLIWMLGLAWQAARLVARRCGRDTPSAASARWLVASAVLTTLTVLAVRQVDLSAGAALWSGGAAKTRAHVLDDLGEPELWGRVLMVAVGQLWYGIVASFGLAVAGIAALVAMARRPSDASERPLALLFLATATSVYVTSVGVMASGIHRADGSVGSGLRTIRWDHHVYGRYVDAVVVVLAVVGLVRCWRSAGRGGLRSPFVAAGLALLGAAALAVRFAGTDAVGLIPYTVGGLSALTGDTDTPLTLVWGTIAAVAALAIGWAARRGRTQLVAVVATILVLGSLSAARIAVQVQDQRVSAPGTVAALGAPSSGARLVVAADAAALPALRVGVFPLQFQALHEGWRTELSPLDSAELLTLSGGRPPATDVLVVVEGMPSPGRGWQRAATLEGAELWRRTS